MFKLKNVRYKNIIKIDDMDIKKGQVTCISGPSGSGKSTLLKLLGKIISPDSGDILFEGKNLKDIDSISHRRKVPTLSQFPVIFDGNIRDNLKIGLEFSRRDLKTDDKLIEVLKKVNLNKSLEDDPSKLSGGEKQRLCIGRILLMDADIIMLDEPSASLDSQTEYDIIKLIYEEIKSCGKTMIYITHSEDISENFSDTILEMENGQLINERFTKGVTK